MRIGIAGASGYTGAELLRLCADHPQLDVVWAGAVEETLARVGGDLLVDQTLFDVYRGEGLPRGHRSLAFRLRFCALDHTLTDEEVGEARRRCIEAVESAHRAALRGG